MQDNIDDKQRKDREVKMAMALAEAIKELGSVPSGTLYANVMGHMDLPTYERLIAALVNAKMVRKSGSHLLTWIGKV